MLYLVPTPIGNKGDMTPRAIEVLKEADLILAEDTRVSGPFIRSFEVKAPIFSFHSNNEHHQVEQIIERLRQNQKVVLVSDAGTPGISDPGFLLVRACREAKLEVIALPGATAFVPAIVSSGLPCEKFYYQGFLPLKKGRKTQIEWLAELPCTIVMYESPHRLLKCVEELKKIFGDERKCCLSKEISKMFEQHFYGSLKEVSENLSKLSKIQGEWVIVVQGKE
ncbi:MAG: 16S rRNA (cytidine(1402)-2'-O)-methyltransferase [Saprospiraceae bacterium]